MLLEYEALSCEVADEQIEPRLQVCVCMCVCVCVCVCLCVCL